MYRPSPIPQMDGSAFASANCVAASTAMLIDRATVSRFRYSGADVRFESGDRSGGLEYYTAAKTANDMTGGAARAKVILGGSRSLFRDIIAGGSPAVASISCRVTRYTSRRTNTFTGGHGVYVHKQQYTDHCECEKDYANGVMHREFLVEDPGTTSAGYLWWSADLLYRAMEARGGGKLNFMSGRDTEGVTRTARSDGGIYASASKTSTRIASRKKGVAYPVTSTTTGGSWKRDVSGGYGKGWHHVRVPGTSKTGWVPGESLV